MYNDSSGKLHSLHLTDQGRDIFAMSRMMFELLDRNLFDVLTDEEKEVLAEIMRKLDDRADRIMESLTKG